MAPKKKPTDELKDQRVPIMMSEEELREIDDWSFANRIRSRGEAIRRLCKVGLFADGTSRDILKNARIVTDADIIALVDLNNPDLTNEQKEEIFKGMETLPERVKMIISALSLAKTVQAYRNGSTFEEAVEQAKTAAAEMAVELEFQLRLRSKE